MRISAKGRYGLAAMTHLAQCYQADMPITIISIAEKMGISKIYLEQVFSLLKRAGLVNSIKGAQGGYQLARAPEDITVGDIIDATEGPLSISECISDEGCCHRSGECRTRRVWEYLSNSINGLLQSISLRDMLEQESFGVPTQTKES